ncbi:glycogen debranching protein GlgX [Echinimonas agarilytica]|uniref:Glycogen debranching protein GlgX n=1 Tax=Echinimonas agarilytica TaxID=1215918 RepID=A0AA42B8Y1_9GAMM|nr:glycogen debranching protein GlgX [Echinimonas agarilytica]MCM2681023.1 glycogen debranching protein GlgX [Echinimonas agarilytica]
MTQRLNVGQSYPIGAHQLDGGVNFSLYSQHATAVELLLFEHVDDSNPHIVMLDPGRNRSGNYWHVWLRDIQPGQLYGYRVYGYHQPENGRWFDPSKVLLDPYAQCVARSTHYDRALACEYGADNVGKSFLGVVVDHRGFDWGETQRIGRPLAETIIYEMHVKGFTAHPNSGVSEERRGTYLGVIDKIPYLKDLGVTAVELMPVQQFDPQDVPPNSPNNYWGYSPINFFAPHSDYAVDKSPLGAINEFRQMVKALHEADIEVYLDVVFNHTAEGGDGGPNLSFKGIDTDTYYILSEHNEFTNYSGCGNTFNANHSIARRVIRHALRYWVQQMHVDGFRFDLASVLARDENGQPMASPPILWSIDTDPVLAKTKIIAEAWDAAGLYQVGSFIGDRWQEWNGKYRDDVRAFWKGDRERVSDFANRMIGSPDIYMKRNSVPHRSINFITAHDGFTLNDLVSYNDKHNEANGESNRDGDNHNLSWNCGAEGPTDDLYINRLRMRQMKNFMATLMCSLGTPMLSMGDEVGRTQGGNNNAYCQDNEISWFDWSKVEENADLLRFTQHLILMRRTNAGLSRQLNQSLADMLDQSNIEWHGTRCNQPDWSGSSHTIACKIKAPHSQETLYFAVNAYHEPLDFELPELEEAHWYRMVDTGLESPDDFSDLGLAPALTVNRYQLAERSMILLWARHGSERR